MILISNKDLIKRESMVSNFDGGGGVRGEDKGDEAKAMKVTSNG